MNIKDIVFSDGVRALLHASGRQDRANGLSMHNGWQALATEMGYTANARTPAREAYEDGWYDPT